MNKITSRDNQKLKFARKVRDGKIDNQIFIEGYRIAVEAIKSQVKILQVFLTNSFAENSKNSEFINKLNSQSEIFEVSENIFKSISDTKNPQGIILIGEKPSNNEDDFTKFDTAKHSIPIVVLLHKINNPSNLGAVLRSAEAVGVNRIIKTTDSVNIFSPKVLRASMGSGLRMQIWEDVEFDDALEWAGKNGYLTTCADINSKNIYTEIDWTKPRLLIFGSEAHGLSVEERSKINENLFIPMENQVESLNLAVSCGVILFEAKRQFAN